jgi:hypothetical protein
MQCRECGKEISKIGKSGPPPKLCTECSQLKYKYVGTNKNTIQVCQRCGKEFHSYHIQQFCSLSCKGIAFRRLKGTTRFCGGCSLPFEPKKSAQIYCSQRCVKRYAYGSNRQYLRMKAELQNET